MLACSSVCHIKTESIRKLSNFNFQWQKSCTTIIQTISHTFFTFFKQYRYNVICNNTKDYLSSEPKKVNVKFCKNCENTGKILKISCVRCHFVKFDINIIFLGSHKKFSLVLLQVTNKYYIYSPWFDVVYIILVQGFCLLKTKITQFPDGFHLKHYRTLYKSKELK